MIGDSYSVIVVRAPPAGVGVIQPALPGCPDLLPHYWRSRVVFPISALGNIIVPGGVTVGAPLYAGIVYADILAYRAAAVFTLIRVLGIVAW